MTMNRTGIMISALLVLIVAFGANFGRNFKADIEKPRPWKGYTDENLSAMATALKGEIERLTSKYESAKNGSTRARDMGFLAEQVDEYHRVQKQTQNTRALGSSLGEKEAMLREIEAEQTYRQANQTILQTFLRRTLTLF